MEYIFELLSISELPSERILKLKFPKKKVMKIIYHSMISENLISIWQVKEESKEWYWALLQRLARKQLNYNHSL